MASPENVAIPADAATTVVPDNVPPAFAASVTVTFPVNPVAVFSSASRAVTCTAGVIAAPAGVATGCTLNTKCVAPPGVIAEGRPGPARVGPVAVAPLPLCLE